MQFTVYRLAQDVQRKLGVNTGRDPLKQQDLEDIIWALWNLFDRWNSEHMMIPFVTKFVFTNVSSSKRIYTIGPNGDFVMPRPLSIEALAFRDSAGTDYPIQLTQLQNYNEGEPYKNTSIGRPMRAFYNPSYPNAELFFEIFPQDSDNLVLWAKLPFDVETCTDVGVTCTTGCCHGDNNNSCSCNPSSDCCGVDDLTYSVSCPITLSQQAYAGIVAQAKVLLSSQYGDCIPCDCPLSVDVPYSGGPSGTVDCVVTAKQKAKTTYNPIRFDEFIQLPPGYYNAILWNLVVDMAPEYDMEVGNTIIKRAMDGVRKIKDVNAEVPELRCDNAILGPGRRWNIFSGPSGWGRNS